MSSHAQIVYDQSQKLLYEIGILDSMVSRYIGTRNDEAISYQSYFDKRFPQIQEMLKGINAGIVQVISTEEEK
jgi:hypothetical protein